MSTNGNANPGTDRSCLVPLSEVTSVVFEMISDILQLEGSCAFTIEKTWSENDQKYVVQTFVHGEMPDFNEAKSQLEHAQMHVERKLYELYANGFGKLTVEVNVTSGRKRALTITSGPTARFIVPFEDNQSA